MDDGFLERFLIAYPEKKKDWHLVDQAPDKAAQEAMRGLCDMLASSEWDSLLPKDDDEFGKPYVKFNEHAQADFDTWLKDHMRELAEMPDDDPMSGFIGKQRGLVVRIALILHLASWASGESVDIRYIDQETLMNTFKLFDEYIVPMWERTVVVFSNTKKDEAVQKIAKWIQDERINRFALWEIHRKQWAGLKDDNEIKKALDVLISHKWLSEERTIKPGPKGGKPWKGWVVNPKIHEKRFTQYSQ